MKKTIFFLFCLILFNRLSQAATNQRSDTFDIKHFGLQLNITDYTNQTISGFANIKVLSKMNNQNQIVFDLLNMNIDSVKVNNAIATYNYNSPFITINLSMPLFINDSADIEIHYHGHPDILLPVFATIHSESHVESYHPVVKEGFKGTNIGDKLVQASLTDAAFRWNNNRNRDLGAPVCPMLEHSATICCK